MRNGLLWLVLGGIPIMWSLSGCVKANIIYGQDQINNGLTNIIMVDSITPVMSTLFVDSLPTSAKGVAFIGGYQDQYFGPVSPRSYFQFSPPPATTIDPLAVFDSATLYLVPTGHYYYGDTTQWVDVYASRIQYEMQFPVTQAQFYNNDSFPVDPTPVGHAHVLLRPNFQDTVYMPLDTALGSDFFNKVREGNINLTNAAQFLGYFPGLQISAGNGTSPEVLYAIKDTVLIKVWYHTPDGQRSIQALQFRYNNKAYQFNEIRNTPQPPLTAFKRQYESTVQQIYSTDPSFNHMAYMSPLLGYTAKIQFPYLRQVYQADSNFRNVLKATLIIHPVFQSFSQQYLLPPSLTVAATDYTNQEGTSVATGILTLDYGGTDTQYSFDITSFIQAEIQDPTVDYYQRGLMVVPPSGNYYNTFNRLVMGDRSFVGPGTAPGYWQTELIIYYVSVINTL
jgi:hypothetical protein